MADMANLMSKVCLTGDVDTYVRVDDARPIREVQNRPLHMSTIQMTGRQMVKRVGRCIRTPLLKFMYVRTVSAQRLTREAPPMYLSNLES